MSLKIVKLPGRNFLYVRGTVRGQTVFESTKTSDAKKAEGCRIKREIEIWQLFGDTYISLNI
jgi:hypothetical protein